MSGVVKTGSRCYVLRSRCHVAKISHEYMNDTLRLHCLQAPTQQMIYVFLCLTLGACLLLYSDRHVGMTGVYCHAGPDKPAPYLIRGHPEVWQDLYTSII